MQILRNPNRFAKRPNSSCKVLRASRKEPQGTQRARQLTVALLLEFLNHCLFPILKVFKYRIERFAI